MSTAERVLEVLGRFGLKQEGSNQYRCNSPFRPGANSMSFTVTINSPEHGSFYDHHPGAKPQKGSLYDLAKLLGVALPATVPVENTKRAYTGIEDYARAHGVTGDVLRTWGWRELVYEDRLALEFQTPSGLRWRYIDGHKGKPTYKSVAGYTRCWYGLGENLAGLLLHGKPLVFCNGEISTIVGRHYGVPTLAMTSGEKGEIPHELLGQLQGFVAGISNLVILIALDCDKPGRTAAHGLQAQLRGIGFNVQALDLSLGTGGDLADFCMLYGEASLAELQRLPALKPMAKSERWAFASVDDVLNLPPIDWLVPGQIPARGLTMVYGASGTYKSFFMLEHAIKLALSGINSLYIAAEGEHGYRPRLEAWIAHNKAKPEQLTFVLGQVDLFDEEELVEFTRLVQVYKPRMVVVDTFAMCSGVADENHTRDMQIIVNGCKQMSKQLDGVIVVVHHTNAGGKKERGSKALRNACDTVIRLSLEDDLIAVESQKTKDTKPFETYFLAALVIPLGYMNNLGEEVTSVVLIPRQKLLRGNELTSLQHRVLEVVAVEPKASISEIAEMVECDNRGTVQKVVARLLKLGLIRLASGGRREITDEGARVLNSAESSDSIDSGNDQEDPDVPSEET